MKGVTSEAGLSWAPMMCVCLLQVGHEDALIYC